MFLCFYALNAHLYSLQEKNLCSIKLVWWRNYYCNSWAKMCFMQGRGLVLTAPCCPLLDADVSVVSMVWWTGLLLCLTMEDQNGGEKTLIALWLTEKKKKKMRFIYSNRNVQTRNSRNRSRRWKRLEVAAPLSMLGRCNMWKQEVSCNRRRIAVKCYNATTAVHWLSTPCLKIHHYNMS